MVENNRNFLNKLSIASSPNPRMCPNIRLRFEGSIDVFRSNVVWLVRGGGKGVGRSLQLLKRIFVYQGFTLGSTRTPNINPHNPKFDWRNLLKKQTPEPRNYNFLVSYKIERFIIIIFFFATEMIVSSFFFFKEYKFFFTLNLNKTITKQRRRAVNPPWTILRYYFEHYNKIRIFLRFCISNTWWFTKSVRFDPGPTL